MNGQLKMTWQKSSWSTYDGNCIEVTRCTSSRSHASGDCAEVATCQCGVLVRDSKNPDGPVLHFTRAAWREFLAEARMLG